MLPLISLLRSDCDAPTIGAGTTRGVHIEIRSFTCSELEYLLSTSPNYRKLKTKRSSGLARSMFRGTWNENGATLSFDEQGIPFDGQHRMQAALDFQRANPGQFVGFIVVSGLPRRTAEQATDKGEARTINNFLSREGVSLLATPLLNLLATDTNNLTASSFVAGANKRLGNSVADMEETFTANKAEILRFTHIAGALKKAQIACPSSAAGALMLIARIWAVEEQEKFEQFVLSLQSGSGLSETSPILALREGLRALLTKKLLLAADRPVMAACMVIVAWNAYITDKKAPSKLWSPGRAFPQIEPKGKKKTLPSMSRFFQQTR